MMYGVTIFFMALIIVIAPLLFIFSHEGKFCHGAHYIVFIVVDTPLLMIMFDLS
jgi:hypothetical protein